MQDYKKEVASHILQAAGNLIGVCLVIITGLKLSNMANSTILDKVAAIASFFFLMSIVFAYLSMRHGISSIVRHRNLADYSFLIGIVLLVIAMVSIAFNVVY